MREGEPVGKGEDGARLAAHGFEKLLARGRIVKQVRDGDDRSVRAAERRLLGKVPPSMRTSVPVSSSARLVTSRTRATAAMEARASPRKPRV